MMVRPRRFCAIAVVCVLTLYVCLAVWLVASDTDMQTVIYRVWYTKGFPNTSEAGEIACYYDNSRNSLEELQGPVTPDTGIFFLETSCHSDPGVHLSPRQACAVESAAKMNPSSEVYVLFPSPVLNNNSALSPSVQQLLRYPNVRLRHVTMDQYFRDTPLEEWYLSGLLRTSHWPRSHASDVLRYLTLWKFGGIYLDLDVVVTKPLTDLVNFAGAESNEDVAAGVLGFSREGSGHVMAGMCLRELRRNFRGYDWGYNGPGVITRVLKRLCRTDSVKEMTPERCKGFTVHPPHTFYPIPWRKWQLYFNTERSAVTLRRLESSHAIHVWNKFSLQANVSVGSQQPYAVIASLLFTQQAASTYESKHGESFKPEANHLHRCRRRKYNQGAE